MRKLLTAGIFGTILSLTGANYAGASIISRGFFDEAMENYATNTALDLKANQTDLTALSNKIGDAWPYSSDMSGGLYSLSWQLYPPEITLENASDLVRFLFGGKIEYGINQGGVLNILGRSVVDTGAYDINTGQIDKGFRSLTQLTNGWTSTDGTTYLGVKDLNTKTGSYYWGPENERYKYSNIPYLKELFSELSPDRSLAMSDMATTILVNYTDPGFPGLAGVTFRLLGGWPDANGALANPGLKGMYEGWTDRGGNYYPGLYSYSKGETLLLNAYNSESVPLLIQGAKATTIDGVDYRGPIYPLWKLSEGINKIGDLPSGSLLGLSPDSDQIYKVADGTDKPVYPANVAEMIQQLYGAPQAGHRGIIPVIGRIISALSQSITTRIGTLPDGKTVTDMISETDAKIGTVPDGKTVTDMISETDAKIGSWNAGYIADGTNNPLFNVWEKYLPQFTNMFQEIYLSRPTSLADLIDKLYGIRVDDSGDWGILGNIGALIDTVGLTTDAIRSKIGTLPDGYDSVGAALTAMKSDIDAKNLPSTSDDGQYVLTAKKVGDTITYTWVKMDLTNEEQAQ